MLAEKINPKPSIQEAHPLSERSKRVERGNSAVQIDHQLRYLWEPNGPGKPGIYFDPYFGKTYRSGDMIKLSYEGDVSLEYAADERKKAIEEMCHVFGLRIPKTKEMTQPFVEDVINIKDSEEKHTHFNLETTVLFPTVDLFDRKAEASEEKLSNFIDSLRKDIKAQREKGKWDPLNQCSDAFGTFNREGKEVKTKLHLHAGPNDMAAVGVLFPQLAEVWYGSEFPGMNAEEISLELIKLGTEKKKEELLAKEELTTQEYTASLATVLVAKALDRDSKKQNTELAAQFNTLSGFLVEPNFDLNKPQEVKNEEKKLTTALTTAVSLARQRLLETKGIVIDSSDIAQLVYEWIYKGSKLTDIKTAAFDTFAWGKETTDKKVAAAALAIDFARQTEPTERQLTKHEKKAQDLATQLNDKGFYLWSINAYRAEDQEKEHVGRVHYVIGKKGVDICPNVKKTVNTTVRKARSIAAEISSSLIDAKAQRQPLPKAQRKHRLRGGIFQKEKLNSYLVEMLVAFGDTETLKTTEKEKWVMRSRALALATIATAAGVADKETQKVASNNFTGWPEFTGKKSTQEEILFNRDRTKEITIELTAARKNTNASSESVLTALQRLFPPFDKEKHEAFVNVFADDNKMSLQMFEAKIPELTHEAFVEIKTRAMEIKTRLLQKELTFLEQKTLTANDILEKEGLFFTNYKNGLEAGALHGKMRIVAGMVVQDPCPAHPPQKVDAKLKTVTAQAKQALQEKLQLKKTFWEIERPRVVGVPPLPPETPKKKKQPSGEKVIKPVKEIPKPSAPSQKKVSLFSEQPQRPTQMQRSFRRPKEEVLQRKRKLDEVFLVHKPEGGIPDTHIDKKKVTANPQEAAATVTVSPGVRLIDGNASNKSRSEIKGVVANIGTPVAVAPIDKQQSFRPASSETSTIVASALDLSFIGDKAVKVAASNPNKKNVKDIQNYKESLATAPAVAMRLVQSESGVNSLKQIPIGTKITASETASNFYVSSQPTKKSPTQKPPKVFVDESSRGLSSSGEMPTGSVKTNNKNSATVVVSGKPGLPSITPLDASSSVPALDQLASKGKKNVSESSGSPKKPKPDILNPHDRAVKTENKVQQVSGEQTAKQVEQAFAKKEERQMEKQIAQQLKQASDVAKKQETKSVHQQENLASSETQRVTKVKTATGERFGVERISSQQTTKKNSQKKEQGDEIPTEQNKQTKQEVGTKEAGQQQTTQHVQSAPAVSSYRLQHTSKTQTTTMTAQVAASDGHYLPLDPFGIKSEIQNILGQLG